jgi:hypothetical protein
MDLKTILMGFLVVFGTVFIPIVKAKFKARFPMENKPYLMATLKTAHIAFWSLFVGMVINLEARGPRPPDALWLVISATVFLCFLLIRALWRRRLSTIARAAK